jgi:hypothetical protein
MPRRPPEDLTNFAPWAEWPRALERVRKAKTDEQAIDALKRHFKMMLTLLEMVQRQEVGRKVRRERINENARERVETMAHAMAEASERGEDWKEFMAQARALDAALHARKAYET